MPFDGGSLAVPKLLIVIIVIVLGITRSIFRVAAEPEGCWFESSLRSHSLQQFADDDSFAQFSRCPFPSPFHASLSSRRKSNRMLASPRSDFPIIFSQPLHVQHDPVGESAMASHRPFVES